MFRWLKPRRECVISFNSSDSKMLKYCFLNDEWKKKKNFFFKCIDRFWIFHILINVEPLLIRERKERRYKEFRLKIAMSNISISWVEKLLTSWSQLFRYSSVWVFNILNILHRRLKLLLHFGGYNPTPINFLAWCTLHGICYDTCLFILDWLQFFTKCFIGRANIDNIT